MGILIALLPIFSGSFIVLAFAVGWIHYRKFRAKSKGLRFPLSQPLLRPAGFSVGTQLEETATDMFAALLGGAFGSASIPAMHAIQTAYLHQPESLIRTLISAAGFIFVVGYSIRSFVKKASKLRNLRLGWAGELATAEGLNELLKEGCQVFHDLPADGFNIDHVVIGPCGVFAVETKR